MQKVSLSQPGGHVKACIEGEPLSLAEHPHSHLALTFSASVSEASSSSKG